VDGANIYTYVHQSPIVHIDALGHSGEKTEATKQGNPGVQMGEEVVNGIICVRFKATEGTYTSASAKQVGTGHSKESGYGAYEDIILGDNLEPLPNPDRIEPGADHLVPKATADVEVVKTTTSSISSRAAAAGANVLSAQAQDIRRQQSAPVLLSRDDLEAILIGDAERLKSTPDDRLPDRINADGWFFNSNTPNTYYEIVEPIGEVQPGIYSGSDINYAFQGLLSGRQNSRLGESALISGFNIAQAAGAAVSGNSTAAEHNLRQVEIGKQFANLGYQLYIQNYRQ
jgi:hypothetical protein